MDGGMGAVVCVGGRVLFSVSSLSLYVFPFCPVCGWMLECVRVVLVVFSCFLSFSFCWSPPEVDLWLGCELMVRNILWGVPLLWCIVGHLTVLACCDGRSRGT